MPPKKTTKTTASRKAAEKALAKPTTPAPEGAEDDATLASRYQKVSHVDHILLRPEMYVGSIENHKATVWLFKDEAVRTAVPDLLPPGAFEKKVAELGLGTVSLTKKKKSDEDEETIDEASIDDAEDLMDKDDVTIVNGVDSRLLASEETVSAFPPGSQVVDSVFMNPGLLKIVDEIVVNAADNRLVPSAKKQTYIRVTFDAKTGEITVQNDGAAIPIAKHPEHDMYVPELIFGSLLTSSHYGNDPNSIAAGRHGFGAKLTNILSSSFTVECVKDKMRFVGTWVNNMKDKKSISVGPCDHEGDYTKISFVPEYTRFTDVDLKKGRELAEAKASHPEGLIPADFNIVAELGKILKRRLLDLSASIGGDTLEVYYNGDLLSPKDFAEYVRMHMPADSKPIQPFIQSVRSREGNALLSDYGYVITPPVKGEATQQQHVSLVNGIVTHQGGTHLRHAVTALDGALALAAAHLEREERLMLNVALLKQHTTVFVNALVHQSKFDSQSKDRLVSKHSFAPVRTADLVRHILLLPHIRSFCLTSDRMTAALETAVSAMGTRGKNLMQVIPKLVEPADMTIPMKRTLILTEGDSAKALALNSLSAAQRQIFGVLPLRGKMLNVRNAHPRKIAANKEVVNLMATIGLSTKNRDVKPEDLRYQRILVMTDQDFDGFHIRGLIISFIGYYWPALMKAIPDFVSIFSTPLIKARIKGETTSFYSASDYSKWYAALPPASQSLVKAKYYKGLGTSSTEEGREYFNNMDNNVRYIEASDPAKDAELLDKAFSNGEENVLWRKHWVLRSKMETDMESGRGSLTIPQFIDQQLVQFALYDNLRSFPEIRDGLRISQRKIIWSMLNRKSSDSMRVSQAAGYVSEASNYHHGESSLIGGIVNLAQTFVGSNNVPILLGEGQFGSRINAGRDAAAARYIFTNISPMARKLFPAIDDELLTYADQEGSLAEPVAYAPILPLQFLNGFTGIGVGFAGRHLPHTVPSVIAAVRSLIDGASAEAAAKKLEVGVTAFRGDIQQCDEQPKRFFVSGEFELYSVGNAISSSGLVFSSEEMRAEYNASDFSLTTNTLIRITELPYMFAIEDYRKSISDALNDVLVSIADNSGANHVDIHITVNTRDFFSTMPVVSREAMLMKLGLTQAVSQYMVCIKDGTVVQYGHNAGPQLAAFYENRHAVYAKRLDLIRDRLRKEALRLEGHIKFTAFVKSKGSSVLAMTEEELDAALLKAGVPMLEGSYRPYFTRSFASLLKTSADQLEAKLAETRAALDASIANDTPQSLWKADLESFETAFTAYEKNIVTTIAGEYKGRRGLGAKMTMPRLLDDLKYLGYSPTSGWALLNAVNRIKVTANNNRRTRVASVTADLEQAEAYLASVAVAAEKAAEAHQAIINAKGNRSSLAIVKAANEVRSSKQELSNATRRVNRLKHTLAEVSKRFGKGDAAAAAAAAAASAAAGGAKRGRVAKMVLPTMTAMTAMPPMDALAIARAQATGRFFMGTAATARQALLRVFSRNLL